MTAGLEVRERHDSGVSAQYYTVEDIAKIMKIGRGSAYKLINIDGFPAIKIGRTIRIPIEEFDTWRARHINQKLSI